MALFHQLNSFLLFSTVQEVKISTWIFYIRFLNLILTHSQAHMVVLQSAVEWAEQMPECIIAEHSISICMDRSLRFRCDKFDYSQVGAFRLYAMSSRIQSSGSSLDAIEDRNEGQAANAWPRPQKMLKDLHFPLEAIGNSFK